MLLAGRYALEEPLGRGAMGEVWRATDHTLDRAVAVKLLHTEDTVDTERFRLEAQTAARLNHPHVVGVYDFGSQDGRFYLVMELISGWSLAQERSLRGTLPPHEAARVVAQMAAGLAAAHQQGVIHRDIKPANVMLTADRTVKITDFGIARFADDSANTLTATGMVLGTADYLPPERALGRASQPSSDVYSLGCVLYELLTGQPPFRGATTLAVVQQHVDAAPPPPAHLRPETPGPLGDYVLRMLAKDPAQRPTAEQAATWLAGPLPESRQSSPAPAPAPPTAPVRRAGGTRTARSRPRGRRVDATKAVLGGAGVLLFAAAAYAGVSLNSDDSPPSPTPGPAVSSGTAPADATPLADVPSTAPPSQPDGAEDEQGQDGHEERHKKGKGDGKHR